MNNQLLAEAIFIKKYLTEICPTGIAAYVADSYDFFGVVTEILPLLKKTIMDRDGTFVIRPDSGDPVEILCGVDFDKFPTKDSVCFHGCYVYIEDEDKYYWVDSNDSGDTHYFKEVPSAVCKGLVECLWDTFGGTTTEEGLRVLDSHIGCIYGDSINLERQDQIITKLEAKGFVPTVVLGIGSFTYQYVTRDTHGSAMKATDIQFGTGNHVAIRKEPKTDASKRSAKGLLRVDEIDGTFVLTDDVTPAEEAGGALQTVWKDGRFVTETSLKEIRERLWN